MGQVRRKPWVRLAHWLGKNWARYHYATRVEPTWLELNQIDIAIRDLPSAFEGLRIAQMSDFHCGPQVTQCYLREAIELAHEAKPDLIVLTGDFIHKGFEHVHEAAQTLGALRAPLGVFAVLGNHDFSVRNVLGIRRHRDLHRAVTDALLGQGIRVLRNEAVPLSRESQQIFLAGVEDLWSRVCDPDRALSQLPIETPRIMLAHNPCTIEMLNGNRCDLMLSGHTHGGQINLPRLGRVTLGPKARRYAAGLYRQGECQLYVNKGIGFGFRVRYRVRPEVAILTLRKRETDMG